MPEIDDLWILVVEDDPIVRNLSCEILRTAGYEVRTASDGAAASSLLNQAGSRPHCVLLDFAMPGLNGHDTLVMLRAQVPDLPVLMISGLLQADVEERCSTERPNDFLKKPFGASELLFRVDVLIHQARMDAGVA